MDLTGKVALVTGASAGIGRAYALALAGAGATVVAAARTLGRTDGDNPERNTLAATVYAAAELSGKISAQVCDVEKEEDIAAAVDHAVSSFGRLDVLVNNAAYMKSFDPLAVESDEWDRMLRINLRGPYLMIKHAAPVMIRQKSGSIVNITARAANFISKGDRAADRTLVYGVSKAGLNRLTFFMAEELREHGIAVNAISPGIVRTDTMLASHPDAEAQGMGKPATPEALGPAMLYLAQQSADTMTGQILHTDEFGKSWP